MERFKSAHQAQRFLSTFSKIGNLFALTGHSASAVIHREMLNRNLGIWASVTQAAAVR
jgi:hypothetical protein